MGMYHLAVTGKGANDWGVRFTWAGYPGGLRVIAEHAFGSAYDAMICACELAQGRELDLSEIKVVWAPPMPKKHKDDIRKAEDWAEQQKGVKEKARRKKMFDELKKEFDPNA